MIESKQRSRRSIALSAVMLALGSCSPQADSPSVDGSTTPAAHAESSETPIPAGSLTTDFIFFDFAVYYLPAPKDDPQTVLDRLLTEKFPQFQKVEQLSADVDVPTVQIDLRTDVAESYAPPDLESLQYFGRGLTREQSESLQDCNTALIVSFGHPQKRAWDVLQSATQLMNDLALETGGLLWDEETREVFTPEAWRERRLNTWNDDVPDVSRHTVIHAYNTDEYVRAITLGMAKFGLPDVVVNDFSWSLNRSMGNLIHLFSQAVVEGAAIETEGQFDLDLKSIRHPRVRESHLETASGHASFVARLSLREGQSEDGDPDNWLVEIGFDRYPGVDNHARQNSCLTDLFGSEDSIEYVKHNEAILTASRRARMRLPALYAAFEAGLQPGEFIQVKAPFDTPDGGQEWMWVEVTSWNGHAIKGLLKSDPFNVPDLQAGQIVEVSQTDVFDYIREFPDGRREGNETSKLIEQYSKDAPSGE